MENVKNQLLMLVFCMANFVSAQMDKSIPITGVYQRYVYVADSLEAPVAQSAVDSIFHLHGLMPLGSETLVLFDNGRYSYSSSLAPWGVYPRSVGSWKLGNDGQLMLTTDHTLKRLSIEVVESHSDSVSEARISIHNITANSYRHNESNFLIEIDRDTSCIWTPLGGYLCNGRSIPHLESFVVNTFFHKQKVPSAEYVVKSAQSNIFDIYVSYSESPHTLVFDNLSCKIIGSQLIISGHQVGWRLKESQRILTRQ